LMAARGEPTPRSLVMMGGPIDARKSPTQVNDLATRNPLSWFENNVIHAVPANYPGRGRRVYPGFLQHVGFVAMNPERHQTSHWDFYEDLLTGDLDSAESHRKFYDEYNAVLDMPAEYYLDTIRVVFQEHLLPRGLWDVAGERVQPSKIRDCALLTIEGELDDISGSGQTRAAHKLCTGIPASEQHHLEVEGAGHYGIFSGRRWRTQVYPRVREFIAAHGQAAVAPAVPAKAKPATRASAKLPAKPKKRLVRAPTRRVAAPVKTTKNAKATSKQQAGKPAAPKQAAKKSPSARKTARKKNAR
ncbi:MAG: polyhydroxyalkanoate depolymerase, partial [Pseudomonadota bacterium]|nr:polyhydroxyalkanoate depolymerase [Pseudomonadota bacterium]